MTRGIRAILAAVTVVLGLGLIVAGIMRGKNGAVVVGLAAASAAAQQWIVMRKQSSQVDKQSQDL